MPSVEASLVDIVREFCEAHRLMGRISARFRARELRFAELEALVGDDEGSVLYRLKERCHTLFRAGEGSSQMPRHREALFDLAVGSLFHEAMSLRENFYQLEVYGPRMRAMRSDPGSADAQADALFHEFERILAAVSARLEEGIQETEALIDQTRQQLWLLLTEHPENGHLARYLIENRALAEEVFESDLDSLLAGLHGDAAAGYALAGRSYLTSGYFAEADRAFAESLARGAKREDLEPLCAYARGMTAYVAADYAECVERLLQWVDGAGAAAEPRRRSLAQAAAQRVHKFAQAEGRAELAATAADLMARLGGGGESARPVSESDR